MRVRAKLVWDKDPSFLKGVRGSIKNKAIRISLNKAAAPIKADVVQTAPKRIGALQKSMRIRTRNYKDSAVWVAIIGPKSDYTRKRKGRLIRPVKYASIMEFGSKWIRGRHFIRRARAGASSRFSQVFCDELRRRLDELLPDRNKP